MEDPEVLGDGLREHLQDSLRKAYPYMKLNDIANYTQRCGSHLVKFIIEK